MGWTSESCPQRVNWLPGSAPRTNSRPLLDKTNATDLDTPPSGVARLPALSVKPPPGSPKPTRILNNSGAGHGFSSEGATVLPPESSPRTFQIRVQPTVSTLSTLNSAVTSTASDVPAVLRTSFAQIWQNNYSHGELKEKSFYSTLMATRTSMTALSVTCLLNPALICVK